jgi:hypothetical protein
MDYYEGSIPHTEVYGCSGCWGFCGVSYVAFTWLAQCVVLREDAQDWSTTGHNIGVSCQGKYSTVRRCLSSSLPGHSFQQALSTIWLTHVYLQASSSSASPFQKVRSFSVSCLQASQPALAPLAILALRTYAVWNSKRYIAIILGVMYAAYWIPFFTFIGLNVQDSLGTYVVSASASLLFITSTIVCPCSYCHIRSRLCLSRTKPQMFHWRREPLHCSCVLSTADI